MATKDPYLQCIYIGKINGLLKIPIYNAFI